MPRAPATSQPPVEVAPSRGTAAHLVVLASGSTGNCSVLIHSRGRLQRATLIDCGLSPRRTRRLLADLGLDLDRIDDVLITHFDTDHFCATWPRFLPAHTRVHVHAVHELDAAIRGLTPAQVRAHDSAFTLSCGARVEPALASHDDAGVVAFRVETERGSLGYATDIGRVTEPVTRALHGVDLLAIESNYCPAMQLASNRPEHLKRRIMGGSGHLSNQQSAEAARAIGPRGHTVLLHLSRQCNTPETALRAHAGAPCPVTVSSWDTPTRPVPLATNTQD